MELFNRFWELNIASNPATQTDFKYTIKQDEFGNSLRLNFDINASVDIRYYSGIVKIYNLEPDKRRNLVYNILGEDFGTGPSIRLVAGYQEKSGVILDGVVQRGFTQREPSSGTWITVLQCGLSFKNDNQITIPDVKVNNSNLLTHMKSWIDVILPSGSGVDDNNRFKTKRAKNFEANLSDAVDKYNADNTLNTAIGYSGPSAKILNEITQRFNLVFYYDNEGFNVTSTTIDDETEELKINENTGMIGSPTYTDTGAKVLSYLKPEYRLFQPIRVTAGVLDKKIKTTQLNHRGDTHTNEWYSEIDASNIGQVIRS
jgi:hypothetical protein